MRKNYFIFDGINSADFDVFISGVDTYTPPERDIESVDVPGRETPVIIDNGGYKPVPISYRCFIRENAEQNFESFTRALVATRSAFRRLEDTYHPETYRQARLNGTIDPTFSIGRKSCVFTLNFIASSRRYLKDGEDEAALTIGTNYETVYESITGFESKPILRVYGTGSFKITGKDTEDGETKTITVEISTDYTGNYIDLDCETLEAYCDGVNCGEYVTISSPPYIFPYENKFRGVSTYSRITKITVTPRWWTI